MFVKHCIDGFKLAQKYWKPVFQLLNECICFCKLGLVFMTLLVLSNICQLCGIKHLAYYTVHIDRHHEDSKTRARGKLKSYVRESCPITMLSLRTLIQALNQYNGSPLIKTPLLPNNSVLIRQVSFDGRSIHSSCYLLRRICVLARGVFSLASVLLREGSLYFQDLKPRLFVSEMKVSVPVLPVPSWDGSASVLDKESHRERGSDRKRRWSDEYEEDLDRGKVSSST